MREEAEFAVEPVDEVAPLIHFDFDCASREQFDSLRYGILVYLLPNAHVVKGFEKEVDHVLVGGERAVDSPHGVVSTVGDTLKKDVVVLFVGHENLGDRVDVFYVEVLIEGCITGAPFGDEESDETDKDDGQEYDEIFLLFHSVSVV